jgi:hypothetical protein
MTAGAVAAVVAESDGLGEGHVEAQGPRHGRGDLGDLESVGESGALVILGKHEYLGLAGETTECRRMEDAVAVAFETRAERIGFLRHGTPTGADGARGEWCEEFVVAFLAQRTRSEIDGSGAGPGIDVCNAYCVGVIVAVHRECPGFTA